MRVYTCDHNPSAHPIAFAKVQSVWTWVRMSFKSEQTADAIREWCESAKDGDVYFGDGFVVFAQDIAL